MAKILLLAIIVWLLIVVIKRYQRSLKTGPHSSKPNSNEVMVQCQHCGLHILQNESVPARGHYYCCEEHSQQSAPDV